jgi:hypothetical protein
MKRLLFWFSAPDTLFAYTRDSLKNGRGSNICCPECNKPWKLEDLAEKSAMSNDERIFFRQVVSLNKATERILRQQ